jgi:O-antigen/teichoic acid export membrane protein
LLTLSAVSGWLSLADLGFRAAAVRAIAGPLARGDRRAAEHAAGATIRLFALVALVVGPLVVGPGREWLPELFSAPAVHRAALETAITWFALQIVAELAFVAVQCLLEGSQRIDLARGLHALRQTFVGAAVAIVATHTHALADVAAGAALATVASLVVATGVALVAVPVRPRAGSIGHVRSIASYGLQIGAINATGVLHRTMDRIVVGAIVGPAAVALVEIATQIANGAQTLLSTAHALTAAAPHLEARGDHVALRALLVRGTRLTVLAATPALAIAAILASPIVSVWMGESHTEAAGLAALAVLGVALAVPAQTASLVLQGTGRARSVLAPASVAVGVNLVASVLLVHHFGVAGSFLATAITAAALLVPLIAPAIRFTGTDPRTFLRHGLAPTVPPAIGACLGATLGFVAPTPLTQLGLGATAAVSSWAVIAWRWALTSDDRHALLDAVSHRAR